MGQMSQYINVIAKEAEHKFKGLVLGYFQNVKDQVKSATLLGGAQQIDDKLNGHLSKHLKNSLANGNFGELRLLTNESTEYPPQIVLVGLGPLQKEEWKMKDCVRRAAALGIKTLKANGVKHVQIEPMGFPMAAGEGAGLGNYSYEHFKLKKSETACEIFIEPLTAIESEVQGFHKGRIYADAQNFARTLSESPANIITPALFCKEAITFLAKYPKIEVTEHKKEFLQAHKMKLLLSVNAGSAQEPRMLELRFNNAPEKQPTVYVGKGITFDSGGISLKPPAGMEAMKADKTGACAIVGAFSAIAALNLPVNVVGILPLCENMPSGSATKPGDVIVGMNGKSVEINNTDAEGRLILADALTYAQTLNPHTIVDLATLTGAMMIALGGAACGVFSSSDELYSQIEASGKSVGELTWRMPLWDEYREGLNSVVADFKNTGPRQGGACSAAIFLKEFVDTDKVKWAHMDIAGTMDSSHQKELYPANMMTGRPTRLLIELAMSLNK